MNTPSNKAFHKTIRVLFVCLGNICRSPTAHALFQANVNAAEFDQQIVVDSAGTGDWHIGLPPDQRAQKAALAHGYDMSHLAARLVVEEDFEAFDYILAMDNSNLQHLSEMKPAAYSGVLGLFLEVAGVTPMEDELSQSTNEVPDPYYGDEAHFQQAIDLIQQGAKGLLDRIQREHGLQINEQQ